MKHYGRRRQMCDREGFEGWLVRAREEVGTLSPFLFLSLPGIRGDEQRRCAELWMAANSERSRQERASRVFRFRRGDSGKIRVGHLSWDFQRGIQVAALLHSLVDSAELAGIAPEKYLQAAVHSALAGELIPLPQELATPDPTTP